MPWLPSAAAQLMLNPPRRSNSLTGGQRAAPAAAPLGPNHHRINAQQIKEQEAINRERRRQDEHAEEKRRQLVERQRAQYAHVPSQYAVGGGDGAAQQQYPPSFANGARGAAPQDDVEITVFVRECDPDAHSFTLKESVFAMGGGHNPPSPQRGSAYAIANNQATAAPTYRTTALRVARPAAGQPLLPLRSSNSAPVDHKAAAATRGEVPLYLRQRKAELDAEKAEAIRLADIQREQSRYPPGHRPLPEEERTVILTRLAERKKNLEGALGRLPMRFDTQAVRNRQREIEAEIAEVEEAERKFSVKRQIFVPI